jgi:hypothetical protein
MDFNILFYIFLSFHLPHFQDRVGVSFPKTGDLHSSTRAEAQSVRPAQSIQTQSLSKDVFAPDY